VHLARWSKSTPCVSWPAHPPVLRKGPGTERQRSGSAAGSLVGCTTTTPDLFLMKVGGDERDALVATNGSLGDHGASLVRLSSTRLEDLVEVRQLLVEAWKRVAPKHVAAAVVPQEFRPRRLERGTGVTSWRSAAQLSANAQEPLRIRIIDEFCAALAVHASRSCGRRCCWKRRSGDARSFKVDDARMRGRRLHRAIPEIGRERRCLCRRSVNTRSRHERGCPVGPNGRLDVEDDQVNRNLRPSLRTG
jgi:hypothetical protein